MSQYGRIPLAVMLAALTASSLSGQQPVPASVESCREAARLVASGEPAPAWARGQIARCLESGGAAIGARWRDIGAEDQAALAELRAWSLQLHDRRILEAMLTTAGDPGRPRPVRLAALQTLVSYVDPTLTVSLESLEEPRPGAMLSSVTDQRPLTGAEPTPPNTSGRIVELLRELKAHEPDAKVRAAAAFLHQAFADRTPQEHGVRPGELTLANVCGTRFKIANSGDVNASVVLADDRVTRRAPLRVRAGQAIEVTLGNVRQVRLLYADREVATAHSSPTACR